MVDQRPLENHDCEATICLVMRKATKSSLCFLVVLNSFVIVFAVALGVVLIVGDVLWRTPLFFDMLEAKGVQEDLERNVTLCFHNSFCRNIEPNVDPLPCCKQRVEEQKYWRTASNSVRIAKDVLQDTETESAESVSQEEEMEH